MGHRAAAVSGSPNDRYRDMTRTIVQQLADFTVDTRLEAVPSEVVHESKRLLLDSIGCAVAAIGEHKGRAGIDYGKIIGGTDPSATIMGTGDRVSLHGAAFANAELINTLDMDAVLPPGHVSPYVLPGAMAAAEVHKVSGKRLLEAIASSHEMSFRLGRAMDNQRDTKDGRLVKLKAFGYASTIFGATAAFGHVKGYSRETLSHALGIAALISPVNPQLAWFEHTPSSTVKYLMSGMLAQQALTAAYAGELGHRGDLQALDDATYGYPRYIGTEKWEPRQITKGLGTEWNFPKFSSIKPYPHCRIMHGLIDCVTDLVRSHNLKPDEIEALTVYVEGISQRPVWLSRDVANAHDAQFCMAHGIAVAAHLIEPGKDWVKPETIHSPSVMKLMERVSTVVHPDYVKLLDGNAASRPARVELKARGELLVAEKRYPKGSPSPDPDSYMTDAELIAKFRHNCDGTLDTDAIDTLVSSVMALENVEHFDTIMRLTGERARPGHLVAAQ
jgi:2-methylcitrate dehydratase PrpD